MGEQLEDLKKSPGPPKKESTKIHLPNIVLNQSTIEKIEQIAMQRGRSRSEIYQEALDFYISIVERNRNVVTL